LEASLLTPPLPEQHSGYEYAHLFPWLESVHELQLALMLARFGLYRHAADGLRGTLELGVIGVTHGSGGLSDSDLKRWFESDNRTPFWRAMCARLFEHERFSTADNLLGLRRTLDDTYGHLCDYAHSRGLNFSSRGQYPLPLIGCQFSTDSLEEHVELMKEVVAILVTLQLVKHPIGMQSLPVHRKIAPDRLVHGLVDEHAKARMTTVLDARAVRVLQELSDSDMVVAAIMGQVRDMPDLSEAAWLEAESVYKEGLEALAAMGRVGNMPDVMDPVWRFMLLDLSLGAEWLQRGHKRVDHRV